MALVDPLQHQQQPSNVLGKFRLIAELGRGGMSEVYLAVIAGPAGFNKLMVVKLIKADLAEDPEFISMFLEEAQLSARLNHPNVVQTNEVGEFNGRYYIAMEYLEGQPYSRILHRLGRDRGLPLGMSVRILSDVLQGLQYAHELTDFDGSRLSVVHRDVTPHNVFVTYDGQVKVVDFGIAKAMNSSHETRTGMLKGKVGYMAPEQARGERVDCRADIFSVGVMLWEAAVGRRMWKGLNEVQILHQLISGEIPSPRSLRPDVSQQLDHIIMQSLATDRQRRQSSALEFQTQLEELMEGGQERATLREIGRVMSQTFGDERTKLKGIIEGQLAKSVAMATSAYQQVALPAFEQTSHPTMDDQRGSFSPAAGLPQLGHGMSGTGPSSAHGAPRPPPSSGGYPAHSASGAFAAGGSFAGGPPSGVPSLHGPATSGSYPGASQSQPSVSNMTGSIASASVSRTGAQNGGGAGSKILLVAAGGLAAASLLGVILFLGLGRVPKPESAATGTASPTSAPTSSPADAAATPAVSAGGSAAAPGSSGTSREISVEVKARPDTAEVLLDGVKIGTGAVKHKLPADGKEHELRVEAVGYAAKIRKIAADEAMVAWEPELARARGGGGGGGRPPPPEEGPKNDRDASGRPKRNIDSAYTP